MACGLGLVAGMGSRSGVIALAAASHPVGVDPDQGWRVLASASSVVGLIGGGAVGDARGDTSAVGRWSRCLPGRVYWCDVVHIFFSVFGVAWADSRLSLSYRVAVVAAPS